jgi:hypothetical protein
MGEWSVGARWWRESIGLWRVAFGLLGALALGSGCAPWADTRADETNLATPSGDVQISLDALALQRSDGWDVGRPGGTLAFADSTEQDVSGGQQWRAEMADLASLLAPSAPPLQPFYVSTLFQSLMGAAGERLRAMMRPIHTAEMDADFARGLALGRELGRVGWPRDTAVVVDAPGARAIAVAAALADRYAPVFTFGDWPHPLGVVPAHETLAATLYYLPVFRAAEAQRAPDAPPVFVLDANRLLPYRDADRQFDNRYFVSLPSAEQLAALGVRHVLYLSADGTQELDDLNHAFVSLCQSGVVDVKMVALADFVRIPDDEALAAADAEAEEDADEADDGDEGNAPLVAGVPQVPWWWWWGWNLHRGIGWPRFRYHACWWDRGAFWADYPIHHPRPPRHAIVIGPPSGRRTIAPPPGTRAAAWTPAARTTIFARMATSSSLKTPGIARIAAPPSFGQVSVRTSGETGRIVGIRAGNPTYPVGVNNGVFRTSPAPVSGRNAVFHPGGGGAFRSSGGGAFRSSGGGASHGAFHPSSGSAHPGIGVFGGGRTSGRSGSAGGASSSGRSGFFGGGSSSGRSGSSGGGSSSGHSGSSGGGRSSGGHTGGHR